MRWHIVRLIWRRETRDLLRDRRTIVLIFIMPVVLYPLLGFVGYQFALMTAEQEVVVGVHGAEHLPELAPSSKGYSPLPALACFTMTPGGGVDRWAGALGLFQAELMGLDYPPLLVKDRFPEHYFQSSLEAEATKVRLLPTTDPGPLEDRDVDAILIIPPGFLEQVEAGKRPDLQLLLRDSDERSRLADRRLRTVLGNWKVQLKDVRFSHWDLPDHIDDPFMVRRPKQDDEPYKQTIDELADLLARMFPFLIIMWAMAGALHPAIDISAGEKERGTLETLLLSPARRSEIVFGKFLAVWVFSSATALWNLAWIGGAAGLASLILPFAILHFSGLFWCSIVTLLMAGLFSAVSLALGTFARSTKEGQYYLLPLFIITMPLTFLPMVPGVELDLTYSLIPITGATLLLQQLMLGNTDLSTWLFFVPVLSSLLFWTCLCLVGTIGLFHREQVLFREAERLGMMASLRRLFGR